MYPNLNREEFEEIVKKAVKDLPPEFRSKLDNVAIVIADKPDSGQLKKLRLRKGKTLILGLFEGVPKPKRAFFGAALPDKITIFQKPIQALARSRLDLGKIVKNTVRHEVAHHFGLDETALRWAEKKYNLY